MKKCFWIAYFVLMVVFLILYFMNAKNFEYKRKFPNNNADAISKNLNHLKKEISPGLTKRDIIKIIGKPQNSYDDTVWVWAHKAEGRRNWSELMKSSDGGWFLVFKGDQLVTNLYPNAAMTPEELLLIFSDCFPN